MPKVGNKEFSYDAKGMTQAKTAAKKANVPMKMGYKNGGKIKMRGAGAATRGFFSRGPMA
tara:strand:- start:63 stop:242 length:180 start_codon:yes stop_codon:yes gene_type:complete